MTPYIPVELRRQVREHFANCCAYCHTAEALGVAIFEIEHIVPRSAGGATNFENLCLSCPTCNRYKSDLVIATDPLTSEHVALFHPQEQQWTEHFAWSADGVEIVGLTPDKHNSSSVSWSQRRQGGLRWLPLIDPQFGAACKHLLERIANPWFQRQ